MPETSPALPRRMQMSWGISEAVQCHSPGSSLGVILQHCAPDFLTGTCSTAGRAIPGHTDSLRGLEEPFLYPLLVFLKHLPFVTGVHVYQVDGITEQSILHLPVQARVRGEAGGVVHLPKQAARLTGQLPGRAVSSQPAARCPWMCLPVTATGTGAAGSGGAALR